MGRMSDIDIEINEHIEAALKLIIAFSGGGDPLRELADRGRLQMYQQYSPPSLLRITSPTIQEGPA